MLNCISSLDDTFARASTILIFPGNPEPVFGLTVIPVSCSTSSQVKGVDVPIPTLPLDRFPYIVFPILSWLSPVALDASTFAQIIILLDPVVILSPAYDQIVVLLTPVVTPQRALYQTAVL